LHAPDGLTLLTVIAVSNKAYGVAADIHEVGVRMLQSAHKRVAERIQQREYRCFNLQLHSVHVEDILKHCEVACLQKANCVERALNVLVLSEVVWKRDVVRQVAAILHSLPDLVVEVDVAQL
jgi:hypothetical protein